MGTRPGAQNQPKTCPGPKKCVRRRRRKRFLSFFFAGVVWSRSLDRFWLNFSPKITPQSKEFVRAGTCFFLDEATSRIVCNLFIETHFCNFPGQGSGLGFSLCSPTGVWGTGGVSGATRQILSRAESGLAHGFSRGIWQNFLRRPRLLMVSLRQLAPQSATQNSSKAIGKGTQKAQVTNGVFSTIGSPK